MHKSDHLIPFELIKEILCQCARQLSTRFVGLKILQALLLLFSVVSWHCVAVAH